MARMLGKLTLFDSGLLSRLRLTSGILAVGFVIALPTVMMFSHMELPLWGGVLMGLGGLVMVGRLCGFWST